MSTDTYSTNDEPENSGAGAGGDTGMREQESSASVTEVHENTIDTLPTTEAEKPENNLDNTVSNTRFISSSTSTYSVGAKVLIAFAFITISCIGIYQVRSLIAPAFFAFTLVLTVRPIQRVLVRYRFPHWLAGTIAIIVLIVVLLAVGFLFTWSMSGIADLINSYTYRVEALINDVFAFADKQGFSTDQIQEQISKNFSVSAVVSALGSVVSSLTSTGSAFVIIAIVLIFVTIDMGNLTERSQLVDRRDSGLFGALSAFEGRVRQYWLVSTIFGLIVAIIDGIVLAFLDIPMPLAWAMLSFITNYIPNIGFFIGLIPPAILGLLEGGPWTALWVIIAYSVINVVIQSFIQPKFTGDAVGLTPTTTFISLLFWAIVAGPLGTILAVPLTLFVKAILVDASPKTRWLDAFLVPDDEVRKKREQGFYDEKSPAPDPFVDFTSVAFHLPDHFRKRS